MSTQQSESPNAATPAPAPPPTTAELEAENAALREQLAQLQTKKIEEDSFEAKVLLKMDKGLTRPQARASVLRQATFDASPHGQKNAARHAARQARLQAT